MVTVSQGALWRTVKQWGLKQLLFLMFLFSNGRTCSLRSWAATIRNPGLQLDFARMILSIAGGPCSPPHQPWVNCVCWPLQIFVCRTTITITEILHAYKFQKMKLLYIFAFEEREGFPRQGRTWETISIDFMSVVLSYEFLPLFNMKNKLRHERMGERGFKNSTRKEKCFPFCS